MARNGINAKAVQAHIRGLPPHERVEATTKFWAWIREGARQGWPHTLLAIGLWGLATFLALLVFVDQPILPRSALLLAAMVTVAGLVLFMIGARREKRWREANPFKAH